MQGVRGKETISKRDEESVHRTDRGYKKRCGERQNKARNEQSAGVLHRRPGSCIVSAFENWPFWIIRGYPKGFGSSNRTAERDRRQSLSETE